MLVEESHEYYYRLKRFSSVNRLAVSFHNANPELKKMAAIDLDNEDVLSFLKDLQSAQVKFLLVGGFAVAFHGLIRATEDLDLWIKDIPENLESFKNVLIQNGVDSLKHVRSLDLVPGFTQFHLGTSGFTIDPMKNLKAFQTLDFDKCYSRAVSAEYNGIQFKVISKSDLLKEKETTNRPKDQGDIEFLRSE